MIQKIKAINVIFVKNLSLYSILSLVNQIIFRKVNLTRINSDTQSEGILNFQRTVYMKVFYILFSFKFLDIQIAWRSSS
jgi:hypothetical protein